MKEIIEEFGIAFVYLILGGGLIALFGMFISAVCL